MSRGLGRTQRYVLDHLGTLRERGDLRHQTAPALAAAMTGEPDPRASTVQSVRQAIRRLADAGLVETVVIRDRVEGRPSRMKQNPNPHCHPMARWFYYDTPDRRMLAVRLPLTGEQKAAEEETRRAGEAQLTEALARFGFT